MTCPPQCLKTQSPIDGDTWGGCGNFERRQAEGSESLGVGLEGHILDYFLSYPCFLSYPTVVWTSHILADTAVNYSKTRRKDCIPSSMS